MLQANFTGPMLLLLPDGETALIEGDEDEQLCGDVSLYSKPRAFTVQKRTHLVQ
jgi:hypothetical protein